MDMIDLIQKRKSVRKFDLTEIDETVQAQILEHAKTVFPLFPEIQTQFEIIPPKAIRFPLTPNPPHYLALYSEKAEGYLINAGFVMQQMELFLQSIGIGCCWVGISTRRRRYNAIDVEDKELPFAIMLAIGRPQAEQFREPLSMPRKAQWEISDWPDERLEPARLAPSARNGQPWYFVHDKDLYHLFAKQPTTTLLRLMGDLHLVDVGIALAHLYVVHPDTFTFTVENKHPDVDHTTYVGTIRF